MPRLRQPSLPTTGPGSAFAMSAALIPKGTTRSHRSNRKSQKACNEAVAETKRGALEFNCHNSDIVNEAFTAIGNTKNADQIPGIKQVIRKNENCRKRSLPTGRRHLLEQSKKRLTEKRSSEQEPNLAKNSKSSSLQQPLASSDACTSPTILKEQKSLSSAASALVGQQVYARQGLAIDTRMLTSDAGREEAVYYLQQVKKFAQDIENKGAAPCFVASTVEKKATSNTKRPSKRASVTVEAFPYYSGKSGELADNISLVPIPPPINACNTENVKAILVPKPLLAHYSWTLFGELVGAILQQEEKECITGKRSPLDVTILTNDIALLCDTKHESHKQGVNRFWSKIQGFDSNSQVRSIEIVVVLTERVALKSTGASKNNGTDEISCSDNERSDVGGSVTSSGEIENPNGQESDEVTARKLHSALVQQCVKTMELQLTLRASQDLKRLQLPSFSHQDSSLPITVGLSTIPNARVGYLSLYRKWVRASFHSVTQLPGRIHFDLPETLDGSASSVSLDVFYKLIPHRVDSPSAFELADDLRALSAAKVELIQLVPISSLDASLLFGTPMLVRAGFMDEMVQYQEMKLLVRCLLDHLNKKQMALLLKTSAGHKESGVVHDETCRKSVDQKLYILMAEELEVSLSASNCASGASAHQVPRCGVLFRYASAYEFLEESAGSEALKVENMDILSQYDEYVENALECLECDAINPLVIDAVRSSISMTTEGGREDLCNTKTESVWDDKVGVGLRRIESSDSASNKVASQATRIHNPALANGASDLESTGSIELARSTDPNWFAQLEGVVDENDEFYQND